LNNKQRRVKKMEKILLKVLAEFPASKISTLDHNSNAWSDPIQLKAPDVPNHCARSIERIRIDTNEGTEIEFKTFKI